MLRLIAILASFSIFGAEVDHYSKSELFIDDVTDQLNLRADKYLQEAIENLNSNGSCDDSLKSEKRLYKELSLYFNNHSKGILLKEMLHDDELSKRVIPLKESIFSNWSIANGFLLGRRSAAKSPLAITPIVKIGEQEVGIDKFEHIFGMGRRYFNEYYLKGKHIRKVLKKGVFKEKTILGGNIIATGIFSYADLVANFQGMRFWNHMLLKRDDILGKEYNRGPFVSCEGGKWVKSNLNTIDFSEYIDAAMDESINCSKFASRGGVKRYKNYLKNMSKRSMTTVTCPMNSDLLNEMKDKYNFHFDGLKGGLSHWLINTNGNEKVSYFNEF